MGRLGVDRQRKYRCLFSSVLGVRMAAAVMVRGCIGRSPAVNPGDFSPERVAETDRGRMQWLLEHCGPQFQLVASAAALVAVVTAQGDVHGEGAAACRRRSMHGTGSVPLVAPSLRGLEAEQVQDFAHRDLAA
jgi:hypothetical protein